MSSAAPGWYPVEGDSRLRWWDGQAWSQHFHDPAGASAATAGLPAASTTATSNGALASSGIGSVPEDALWSAVGKSVRYWLTAEHLVVDRGSGPQPVPLAAVTDVQARQGMSQKARGTSTVQVHVNRGGGVEIVSMEDITDGSLVPAIIRQTANAARLRSQAAPPAQEQPQAPEGSAATTEAQEPDPVQPWAHAPSTADPMELLRMLGELRDAGLLTDEELATKKAQVLSRL